MTDDAQRTARTMSMDAGALVGGLRITIGFFQGIAGWVLLSLVAPGPFPARPSTAANYWATRHPMLFVALALVTSLAPVIAILELNRMARRTLLIYIGLAALVIAGLAAYDIWRDPLEYPGLANSIWVWPSFPLCVCTALGLFIVNQLLEHRERGFPLFAQYAQHFEDGWMRGFQLFISLIFSGISLGVLSLGALLFGLLHIEWFTELIQHNWFRCPFAAMAFAAAIHITDVRPALLKGMRNVVLTLLSWLLPLVVALSLGFLVALCFVGLKPLWDTRRAASILLSACALAILLLNAAYQDGDPATLPARPLRLVGRVAGPVLVPLALLAFYAIALRVHQYGWTPDRVWSIVVALMSLIYNGGYTYAATFRGGWLKPLEPVNVCASVVLLVLLVLLLTPVADPARLSVDSQVSRLTRGKVSADGFDYEFLRFGSARYGRTALQRLANGTDGPVRERAVRMLAVVTRQSYFGTAADTAVTESAFSHATIYPQGAQLPQGFKEANWSAPRHPECLRNGRPCEIFIIAYGAPGETAVLVHPTEIVAGRVVSDNIATGFLYQLDGANGWINTGFFGRMTCRIALAALREGKVTTTAPKHDDLLVAGMRLRFTARDPDMYGDCDNAAPVDVPVRDHEARTPGNMGPAFGSPGGR